MRKGTTIVVVLLLVAMVLATALQFGLTASNP